MKRFSLRRQSSAKSFFIIITDTDFTAKLSELQLDGYVRMIEDGIIRASYSQGGDSAEPINPVEVYEYTIDLGETVINIPRGSALRLEISSSNFPKFDRNPNTGVDAMSVTEFRVAHQTMFISLECPSRLILPATEN